MTSTRFMEDPTGITRVIHYEVSDEDAQAQRRDFAARVSEQVDEILDWAIGSGRIEMSERTDWEPKLYGDPDWGRRTLELLPPNERLAENAFAEDGRIRSLSDQNLEMLGISKRPVSYETDDLNAEEEATRQFLAVLGK